MLDRYVTWQQGQRVGIACLLDLLFGNQLEHINHPAQAQVAAVVGNDEVFFEPLAGAAGQQATDLFQRLHQLYGQEIIAHQATDRLACEQVGRKRLEQRI
ncbi:hypothetical protein D9M71_594480 [compost metagenome]